MSIQNYSISFEFEHLTKCLEFYEYCQGMSRITGNYILYFCTTDAQLN